MEKQLKPGLKGKANFNVTENFLASHVGSGLVNVLSTAIMIGGMEQAAVAAVQHFLAEGFTSVGVHADISHKAATPVGMRTDYEAELLQISENGKFLTFRVTAYDEKELIGEGLHQRVIVNKDKFEAKANNKISK